MSNLIIKHEPRAFMKKYILLNTVVFAVLSGCQGIDDKLQKDVIPSPPEPMVSRQSETQSSESTQPKKEMPAVDLVGQTSVGNNQKYPDVKQNTDGNKKNQAIPILNPYEKIMKIREIEKFSGGTFEGVWKENNYYFLTPNTDTSNQTENYNRRRIFDSSNGNVSYFNEKDFKVYYNLFNESTYPHPNVNPLSIQVDKDQLKGMTLIEQKLYVLDNIFNVVWSPNYQYVSYYLGNSDGGEAYLWKVGDKAPYKINQIERDRYFFEWSPDSRYLVLHTGTSRHRGGKIYNVSTYKVSSEFGYTFKLIFSDKSRWIAYSNSSNLKSKEKAGYEDDETEEIWLMDLTNFEKRLLIKADDHSDYYPVRWNNESELIYSKHDYMSDTNEELQIKVAMP